MKATDALEELGGISAAAPILERVTRKQLRIAVDKGEIIKLGRNRYCLPPQEERYAAVRRLGGHLSHLSAAEHHGWEICFPPDHPQVVIPVDAVPKPSATRSVEVFRHDVPPADGAGWATSPLLTVLLCARDLSRRDALAVADSALRHGDVTHDELAAAAARWQGTDSTQMQQIAAYADGRAANPFESALRCHAITAGLSVVPQYEVRAGNVTLHPDLADPLLGIAVEADSWTHHGASSTDHDRDCARYNSLVLAGWTVLRFTWTQVMFEGAQVVSTLERARANADRRP